MAVIGVLAMHGLTTAAHQREAAAHASAASLLTDPTGSHDGEGHRDLAHLGATCIWLLVTSGVALACLRSVRQGRAPRGSTAETSTSPAATAPSPAERSHDPPNALVPLRC